MGTLNRTHCSTKFMATYLLTWNPAEWAWEDLAESSQKVKSGESVSICWSCGNTKKIKEGDRVFILRQGIEPKGICASGIVTHGSFEDINWAGNVAQYIECEFDMLLNPYTDEILPRHLLEKPPFTDVHWNTQRSGISIPEVVAVELEKLWEKFAEPVAGSNPEPVGEVTEPKPTIDERQRIMAAIVQRRGQSEFRHKLLNAYSSRCPITNCDAEAALEAAHIIPYQGVTSNNLSNGLPLRADIHTLFDLYLLSIQPDTYKVHLSPKLASTSYSVYAGQKLKLPRDKSALPDKLALEEHYTTFLRKN